MIRNFGQTMVGDIKNYTPVTDAMLTNPPDGEWLIGRGNYAGWSYSPLKQIDGGNVHDLQLQWVWAMNEGGANETSPIVHDGIMFLGNTYNTMQALDAKTGELLWENRVGPAPSRPNYGGMRSIAVWGDKVYFAGNDAVLHALDAKTGKLVWSTPLSDVPGHNNTSGVMAVHGKIITGLTGCGRIPAKDHCYISAYDAKTGKQVWKFVTVALTGQPGGDTWGELPDEKRAGAETWIQGSYDPELNTHLLGHGPGQALAARPARLRRGRDRLCQFHPRAGCRHRQAEMVLQPRARREPGSGRGVRTHPDRSWRQQDADDDGQGRHSVEAGPRHRQVHRLAARPCSRTSWRRRTQVTGEPPIARTIRRPESRSVAVLLPRAGRRQGLAGGQLSPADRHDHSCRSARAAF